MGCHAGDEGGLRTGFTVTCETMRESKKIQRGSKEGTKTTLRHSHPMTRLPRADPRLGGAEASGLTMTQNVEMRQSLTSGFGMAAGWVTAPQAITVD